MNNEQISWIKSASQLCVAFSVIGLGVPAVAQIIPDATLGAERALVAPDATVRGASGTLIEGGAVRGSNLFQSFQEFNVGNGQRVYFANPIGVQTIFSRVTGANASNILGTLGVDGGANLFLLNPNGILFGPKAQLDLRGSFLATTGRVVFADGSTFGASNPQAAPLLTMSAPVGVQYGANATGTIQNRGNLAVGQDLTLTANNLDLQGQLQAGRDLNLQAQNTVQIRDTTTQPFLARSGRNLTIQGNQSVDILALNHPQTPIQSGGNLSLISNGTISGDAHFTSGGTFSILNLAGSPGEFISLYDPIIYADGDVTFGNYSGFALKVEATGSISGGTIKIIGADTSISLPSTDPDLNLLASGSTLILRAGVPSVPAPNVPRPEGGTVFASSPSQVPGNIAVARIDTSTRGTASVNGGDIILFATGSIAIPGLDNNPRFAIGSFIDDTIGNAGNITIQAGGDITIGSDPITRSNAPIFSFGAINASVNNRFGNSGNSGTINISSTGGNITVIGGIFTNSTATGSTSGNSGSIYLQALQGTVKVDANPAGTIVTRTSSSGVTGDAGNIDIAARNITLQGRSAADDSDVTTESTKTGLSGNIYLESQTPLNLTNLQIGTDARDGGSGDITIDAPSLTLERTKLSTTTQGLGQAGNIEITATNGLVLLDQGTISSRVQSTNAEDAAGDITVTAASIQLLNASTIETDSDSLNSGPGFVTLEGRDRVEITNSKVTSDSQNNREDLDFGSVLIQATQGSVLLNQATVSAKNMGAAFAADIYLNARDRLEINNSTLSGDGNFGRIFVGSSDENFASTPPQTVVINRSSLTTDNAIINGAQDAGNISVRAIDSTSILGNTTLSGITSGVGLGGDIAIETGSLLVDHSTLNTSTRGQGNAGIIQVLADNISITGNSTLSGVTSGAGAGGDIAIEAGSLLVDHSTLNTSTLGQGDAGNLSIAADTSILLNASQLLSVVQLGATGKGGNIGLAAPTVTVQNGAGIRVDSEATTSNQAAGTISIEANRLTLNRDAFITAETASGAGGDIQITARDLLLLRRNSAISSTAGSPQNGGNGGNINISAPQGFVIAVPSENSDIIANAFGGRGGKVTISANRVFGLQTRNRLSPAQLSEIRRNGTSDISASSDVGLDGQISISTLQIDPSQGLAEVPVDLIDPSSLIAQGCQPGNAAIATRRSEFVITGRGGLPPGPSEVQMGGEVSVPWVSQARVAQAPRSESAIAVPTSEQSLVEAQGIAIAPNGAAFLTAQTTTATPVQSGFATATCPRQ